MNAVLGRRVVHSEFDLVSVLVRYFKEQGANVRVEVPNMGRSIDVVVTNGRWVTAVEAKLSKWRKGLVQCDSHRTVADFIVLTVALKSIPKALRDAVELRGFGLIQYDSFVGELRWVVRPRRNLRVWRPQRMEFAKNIREIDYAI